MGYGTQGMAKQMFWEVKTPTGKKSHPPSLPRGRDLVCLLSGRVIVGEATSNSEGRCLWRKPRAIPSDDV